MNAAVPPVDGRRLRWQRHNEERRQLVIDAATALLEEREPGAELHVQEIAEHAGMNRSVVYRHFQDRADLDLAVQVSICGRIGDVLMAAAANNGTPREVVHAIVDAYVRWAVAHPSLISVIERNPSSGGLSSPFEATVREFAELLEVLITTLMGALEVELSEDDIDLLDPLIFGLIGGVFQSTQRWMWRANRKPTTEMFVAFLANTVWHQIVGTATDRGIEVPDVPIGDVIAALPTNV